IQFLHVFFSIMSADPVAKPVIFEYLGGVRNKSTKADVMDDLIQLPWDGVVSKIDYLHCASAAFHIRIESGRPKVGFASQLGHFIHKATKLWIPDDRMVPSIVCFPVHLEFAGDYRFWSDTIKMHVLFICLDLEAREYLPKCLRPIDVFGG